MIKNLIFDLGNVLLRFAPLEYLRTKLTDECIIQQLNRDIFLSEEWLMLDRGIITEKEAIDRIAARSLGRSELIRSCMNQWYEIFTPIEEAIDVLKQVKARGYNTYILSNFHLLAYENVTQRYNFFKYFDGGIISYQENLLKPEVDIYNKLIARYDIQSNQSIFIDDTKINVESAKELGFKTILYNNPVDLLNRLVKFGVLIENVSSFV